MKCNYCGADNKEGNKFCSSCGAELKEAKKTTKKEEEKKEKQEVKEVKTEPVKTETTGDGKGTASLVLGIISFVVWCVTPITSIIGLILGICAKKSGKKIAGIILNAIALVGAIIGLIIFFSFGYFAALVGEEATTPSTPSIPSIITPSNNNKTGKVTASSTILFDGFEITLGNNYSIVTVDNTASANYGKEVIKLPATIKNVSATGDHLNMFYYDYYAPDGSEIDSVRNDFGSSKDAIDYVHVSQGDSKLQYFYIQYKGNGKYKIKFNNYKDTKEIEFTIKK